MKRLAWDLLGANDDEAVGKIDKYFSNRRFSDFLKQQQHAEQMADTQALELDSKNMKVLADRLLLMCHSSVPPKLTGLSSDFTSKRGKGAQAGDYAKLLCLVELSSLGSKKVLIERIYEHHDVLISFLRFDKSKVCVPLLPVDENAAADIACATCGLATSDTDDPIILCDNTTHDPPVGFHIKCIGLDHVPPGDWLCSCCIASELGTIERVIDKKKESGVVWYLCKWHGYSDQDNSWQRFKEIPEGSRSLVNDYNRNVARAPAAGSGALSNRILSANVPDAAEDDADDQGALAEDDTEEHNDAEEDGSSPVDDDAPVSPPRPQGKHVDVSGDSPGPQPPPNEEACVLRLHNTSIFPRMISDEVLLESNGCYTDGLVDLFFGETAAKYGTQCISVTLAQKLSEVNSNATGRYEPNQLLNYGKSLVFDNQKGIISFPISVTTSTSHNTAGGPKATTDFHYSVAVYSFAQNKIFHADSLRYQAHKFLVIRQLASWIELVVQHTLGKSIGRPERVEVPCPDQKMTRHCGPASCENNRMIIADLKSPALSAPARMRLTYDDSKFAEFRSKFKAELMALIHAPA